MTLRTLPCVALIALLGAFAWSCDSDSGSSPQSPSTTSVASGTVVFAQSGAPAPNVDVTFERCADSGTMMMHDDFEHNGHMTTDQHGRFHFEYMHDGGHRYRVRVDGSHPDGMCYLTGGVEDDIVLKIAEP
jgi:hypothetical protein